MPPPTDLPAALEARAERVRVALSCHFVPAGASGLGFRV